MDECPLGETRKALTDMAAGWLDEGACKSLWRDQVRRDVSDEEWEELWLQATGAPNGEEGYQTPLQALEDLRQAADRLRRTWGGTKRETVIETLPPKRWSAFQLSRFRIYEGRIRRARELFGLDGPVDYALVPDLLKVAEAAQSWPSEPCESVRLWFVDEFPNEWNSVLVYLPDEFSEHCYPMEPKDAPTFASDQEQARWETAWRSFRLPYLWEVVHAISGQTGAHEFGVLHYILCGGVPVVPWISAQVLPPSGEGYGQWVQIKVGGLTVRPEEVAAAYKSARHTWQEDWGMNPRFPVFRRTSADGEEMVQFSRPLRAMRPRMSWSDIRSRWNAEHPDQQYGPTFERLCRRHAEKLGVDL